jgi:bilirubin oxidase
MKKLLFVLFLGFKFIGFSQSPLFIPDTVTGPNYTLTMHKDSVQFFPGNISHTYAYNTNKYLGPTLILKKGTTVNITFNNQISDTTTVHWHGIHLPAIWDGGPQSEIFPSGTWNPQFTVKDNAATYWYHPHPDKKTTAQAIKGAAGLIIVRDSIEAALALPRKYGVDDFPIIVQCQQYNSANQAMPLGMQDSTILVNGARANNGYTVQGNFPAQVVRMRLLNASGERTFNFGFTGNKQFYQIASDGGLLNTPNLTTRIRLAPGERAEIVMNLTGMNGQSFYLMSYASELTMGIQGGPTMPMPPNYPPMNSPLNGINFNIMKVNVIPQTINPVTTIPATLITNNPYTEISANITRTIRFTADSAMVMDGPFYFNDSTFDMMRIDYKIPFNNIEIWKLVNETMVAHPFHIHDVQFFILDRNGNLPSQSEMGRKDVVLVPPGDSLRFIAKFTDFADSLVPYMYHCHILMHEDDGMMGQFVVMPNSAVGVSENRISNNNIKIYPNPANKKFYIDINSITTENDVDLNVYNTIGELILSRSLNKNSTIINCENWPKGIYFINLKNKDYSYSKKIIIE